MPSSTGRERAADEHFGGERPGGHAGGDTTGDDGDRMWPEGRTGVLDDFLRELDEIEADYIRRWSRTVRIPHV